VDFREIWRVGREWIREELIKFWKVKVRVMVSIPAVGR